MAPLCETAEFSIEQRVLKDCGTNQHGQLMEQRVFEILRAAVNIARYEEVRRLSALRARLAERFPGEENHCQAAIAAWANSLVERHPNRPPKL